MKEGWTWLIGTPKWHYFREGRSLCGKWMLLGNPELDQRDFKSKDNCMACFKKRIKEAEDALRKLEQRQHPA